MVLHNYFLFLIFVSHSVFFVCLSVFLEEQFYFLFSHCRAFLSPICLFISLLVAAPPLPGAADTLRPRMKRRRGHRWWLAASSWPAPPTKPAEKSRYPLWPGAPTRPTCTSARLSQTPTDGWKVSRTYNAKLETEHVRQKKAKNKRDESKSNNTKTKQNQTAAN